MYKSIIYLITSLICAELYPQEAQFYWTGNIRGKNSKAFVTKASVKLFSDTKIFIFTSDNIGNVIINYYAPEENDSISVSAVGYKPYKISCQKLLETNEILIEEEFYHSNKTTAVPRKKEKAKTYKLGNTKSFATSRNCGTFDDKKGLLIKYQDESGQITKIRYYLKSHFFSESEEMRYCPFRVLIFDVDTTTDMPNKEILNEYLIVSLSKGHWLEVDISCYNIQLPEKAVFIGMETLPYEYYQSNNFMKNESFFIKTKKQTMEFYNGICIGTTKKIKNCESLYEHRTRDEATWKKNNRSTYLINIEIEK